MTNEEYKLHLLNVRELYIKLEILNTSNIVLDQIEGYLIDGNININADSSIRRTCDITLFLKQTFIPSPTSPIWLNKRFRVFIGLKNFITDTIYWFNKGIYIMNNPSIDISINNKTMNIKGLDLACFHTGDVGGDLLVKTVIDIGTPIHEAIRTTINVLSGETNYLIDNHDYVTPYKLEKKAGDKVWDIIKELTDLYMNWESFYDENGYFHFSKKKNLIDDPIVWDFKQNDIKTSITNELQFSNIKNHIVVWGKLKNDGTQPKHEIYVRDNNYPTSPFTIEKLNEPIMRNLVIEEDKYYTVEQCQQRAEYEVYLHTNMAEQISITCMPIYTLDVNKLIYVEQDDCGVMGKYCVQSISLPLRYDGLMQIQAYKIY